jgi:membrane protease YdiL (CAAX protease family)
VFLNPVDYATAYSDFDSKIYGMESKLSHLFFSLWNRVLVLIKATIQGLVVSTIGVACWSVVAIMVPMPFSVLIMFGVLLAYVKFFSGKWGTGLAQQQRKKLFRVRSLSGRAWVLALTAAVLCVVIEQSGLVFTFRLIEFPAEQFKAEYQFLETIPTWAAWLMVIMISIVAGVCEETGFRGYMQRPLEDRYGPAISITLVSVVFVVVHLHQQWSGPILAHVFLISVLLGLLAYNSGSLIPGMIAHVVLDVFNFSFWWSDLGGQFGIETIYSTGIDIHFILWTTILLMGIVSFLALMPRLRMTTKGQL